ncbi:hypothetical protein DC522_05000 [Microvirga sp. KLBC 81]|uniref:hypothetical protein n=1 Tax=Microvirga sp. KLBC 81 TaxID=1862707 RepID=UPI000D518070|nr:hypothetical protein [Microvirga sp. KLBC 81]PVE25675.1 hypothetical protein DC522_05000 [Microvirga sp. KLBC 81]
MPHWKSTRSHAPHAERGEVEKISVERILFVLAQAAFLAIMLKILDWSIWSPIADVWANVSHILSKPRT